MTVAGSEGSSARPMADRQAGSYSTQASPQQGLDTPQGPVAAGALGGKSFEVMGMEQSAQEQAPEAPPDDLALRPPVAGGGVRDMSIQLALLQEEIMTVMAQMSQANIDANKTVRSEQTQAFAKKMEEMMRKLLAAADNWMKHLPSFVRDAAMALITVGVAAMAISATVASGGVAAAPALAAAAFLLSLAAATSVVYALGEFVSQVEGKGTFGGGAGQIAKNALTLDLAGITTDIAKAAGTADPKKLAILGGVVTALTAVLMVGAFMKSAPALDAALGTLSKNVRLLSSSLNVTSASASGAQTGVTFEAAKTQSEADVAQADMELAKTLMQMAADALSQAIRLTTEVASSDSANFKALQDIFDSHAETTHHLLSQPA